MKHDHLADVLQQWADRIRRPSSRHLRRPARRLPLGVEQLDDRIVPAVLPAPTPTGATIPTVGAISLVHTDVNGGTPGLDYLSPQVSANPADPAKMFMAVVQASTNNQGVTTQRLLMGFSTDG